MLFESRKNYTLLYVKLHQELLILKYSTTNCYLSPRVTALPAASSDMGGLVLFTNSLCSSPSLFHIKIYVILLYMTILLFLLTL